VATFACSGTPKNKWIGDIRPDESTNAIHLKMQSILQSQVHKVVKSIKLEGLLAFGFWLEQPRVACG
jgi:hypothetical protein